MRLRPFGEADKLKPALEAAATLDKASMMLKLAKDNTVNVKLESPSRDSPGLKMVQGHHLSPVRSSKLNLRTKNCTYENGPAIFPLLSGGCAYDKQNRNFSKHRRGRSHKEENKAKKKKRKSRKKKSSHVYYRNDG